MSKRFTDTEIWGEDWFIDMPNEYKLFWFYMLSTCDHSGIFKVNTNTFCRLNEVKLSSNRALEYFNNGKQRIRVIQTNVWFVEEFFVYQYGVTFNTNNRVHESIKKVYEKYNIDLTSIRGLKDHKDGVKDKDKDIDKDIELIEIKKDKKEKYPTLEEFMTYCKEELTKNGFDFSTYKFSLESKYLSWSENEWKDGFNKKIKSWKAKIRNVLPHLKPIQPLSHKNGTNPYQEQILAARKTFKLISEK